MISRNSKCVCNVDRQDNSDCKEEDDGHKEAEDQSLWRLVERQARQGQARISRFDARFTAAASLYSPTCSPLVPDARLRNAETRVPVAEKLALPYANQIKVAPQSIHRGLRRDFEESARIHGRIPPGGRRRAGALWMAEIFAIKAHSISSTTTF